MTFTAWVDPDQHEPGKWGFWDETYDFHGGYDTIEEAEAALEAYEYYLDTGIPPENWSKI